MMKELKEELKTISTERVYIEFSKALLTDKPSIFFEVLKASNTLEVHFKPVFRLIGAEQPVKYHPEGDAYNHTMIVLDKVAEYTKNFDDERKLEIRFAGLVHDFGKGATPKSEYPHHYMHEQRGVDIVRKFGKELKLPERLIKCGKTSCSEHMRGGKFYEMTPQKMVKFIERVDRSILGLDGLQLVVKADNKSAIDFDKFGRRCMNEINGEYIKKKYTIEDGIQFGQKLHEERVRWVRENKKDI